MRHRIYWTAIMLALAACSPIDIPTPFTVETTVATKSADGQATPSLLNTPTAASTVESPLSTPDRTTPTGQLALVDQASEFDASRGGWWSIRTLSPIGQTFTPSFAGLDAIELWTEDQWRPECAGTGPGVQIHVREAGIDGSIVSTSLTVTPRSCFKGITYFAFPGLVPLTPGRSYWLEITQPAAGNWGVVWQQLPDPYSSGATIVLGKPGGGDVWFRTGLASLTPRTKAYCADGLWQHVRRDDGAAFSNQSECLQSAGAGQ